MRTKRLFAALLFATLFVAGCGEPETHNSAAAEPPPELTEEGRSPDELEPIPPAPPAGETTGAALATLHAEAMRQRAGDPSAAAGLLEGACERGFGASCLVYAEMLERGEGVTADPDGARAVLEEACFREISNAACDRLGH